MNIKQAFSLSLVFGLIMSCGGCRSLANSDYALQQTELRIQQAYQRGDLVRTEALLRQHLKSSASDAAAWLLLGQVLLRSHDYAAAQEAYQTAIYLEPQHAQSWYQLAVSHLRLATEALIEADARAERTEPTELLLWLLEVQTGLSVVF